MSRNGELGHLYHDSGINSEYTALDAKERLRTREINAREERYLNYQTKILDQAKRITEKQHRYLSKSIRNELEDITAKTASLGKKKPLRPRRSVTVSDKNSPQAISDESHNKPIVLRRRYSLPSIGDAMPSPDKKSRAQKSRHSSRKKHDSEECFLPKIDNPNIKYATKHFQTRVQAIHRTLKALEKTRGDKIRNKQLKVSEIRQQGDSYGINNNGLMPLSTVNVERYDSAFVTHRNRNAEFPV